jgi:hypothetical protein
VGEPARPALRVLALVLAWIYPGLGHAALGRRLRGAAFAIIVTVAFVVGISLDGRLFRPDSSSPLSFLSSAASYGSGLLAVGARALGLGEGDLTSRTYEYGTTFLLSAGIMNVLLIFDAFDLGAGRKR